MDLFRAQGEAGHSQKSISDLFIAGWNPAASNTNGIWARQDDHREAATGPEICWDNDGSIQPLGLADMTDDEKEVR